MKARQERAHLAASTAGLSPTGDGRPAGWAGRVSVRHVLGGEVEVLDVGSLCVLGFLQMFLVSYELDVVYAPVVGV